MTSPFFYFPSKWLGCGDRSQGQQLHSFHERGPRRHGRLDPCLDAQNGGVDEAETVEKVPECVAQRQQQRCSFAAVSKRQLRRESQTFHRLTAEFKQRIFQ